MLSGQHVDVDLLDLLFFVEIGNDRLGTKSDGFVSVDVPASD